MKSIQIKVLLWDVDGTILNFKAAEKAGIRKGFSRLGLNIPTDEQILDYSHINDKYWQILERKEMTKPEILVKRFEEFFSKYGYDTKYCEEFNKNYQLDLADTIVFFDNAPEVIKSIPKSVHQFVVTNGTVVAQHKKLKNSGLDQMMEGCFISDEIGFQKPSIEFFNVVFAKIKELIGDFSKEEVLIVGDSLTSDILGGNNAGIKTCWYNPFNKDKKADVSIDFEIHNLNEVITLFS